MKDKKVAFVTGATGGIGSCIAKKLYDDGYFVVIHGNSNMDKLQKLKEELGEDCYIVSGDLSKYENCEKIVDEILGISSGIDVLVNNAGITKDNLILRMKPEDFSDVIETNLNSAFYLSKLISKTMLKKKYGRIINISSISGLRGNAGQTNYSAAKAGMIGFTKALAKELAGKNILVNAIAPGFIQTPMTDKLSDDAKEKIFEQIPLKKFGSPEDVADLVGFLASDYSKYITGQIISVDGGMGI